MFAKTNRLKKNADFRRLFKEARTVDGDSVQLRYMKNGLDHCRFGFITGLAISKKATVRNKIRRQLNEIIKALFSRSEKSLDILIVAKRNIVDKTHKEIAEDVKDIFKKAKITSQ
jgi:ribonuclease P protein component